MRNANSAEPTHKKIDMAKTDSRSPATGVAALKKLLPASWYAPVRRCYHVARDTSHAIRTGIHDTRTYIVHSGAIRQQSHEARKTRIIKALHRLEKGLALKAPRPGFGMDAVDYLFNELASFSRDFPSDWTIGAAMDTIEAYLAFNQRHGIDCSAFVTRLAKLKTGTRYVADHPLGGIRSVTSSDVTEDCGPSFGKFARTRFSIRQYTGENVAIDAIEAAVATAQYAPSVCNRQSCGVYVASGQDKIQGILAFQNGNRGFGQDAGALLIVTSDLRAFHTYEERNQCWIDGGLFSMALVYALHGQGLGTCCLNWSVDPNTDRSLKELTKIPPSHAVIMLIAVGHIPEKLSVARSERRPMQEVLFRL